MIISDMTQFLKWDKYQEVFFDPLLVEIKQHLWNTYHGSHTFPRRAPCIIYNSHITGGKHEQAEDSEMVSKLLTIT